MIGIVERVLTRRRYRPPATPDRLSGYSIKVQPKVEKLFVRPVACGGARYDGGAGF
jgi:hypothetical protein